jgi:hypothetical protein
MLPSPALQRIFSACAHQIAVRFVHRNIFLRIVVTTRSLRVGEKSMSTGKGMNWKLCKKLLPATRQPPVEPY